MDAGIGSLAGGALGGLFQIGGAILGSRSANRRANALRGIAETPGIDANATTAEAIANLLSNLPGAENFAGQANDFNEAEIESILEQAIPGYKANQAQRSKNITSLLEGRLPDDVAARVERKAAERGVSGGFSGSRFGTNLGLRDLGLTSLDAIMTGTGMFQNQVSGTPRAELTNPVAFAGMTPQQLISLREAERIDKMNRLTTAAGAPTGRDVWGKALTDIGGEIAGASAGGAMGGFGKAGSGGGGIGKGVSVDWLWG